MQRSTGACLVAAALALPACRQSPTVSPMAHSQTIAWRQGDVADAFAEAKESRRPVILYWGANWCPPCAQLKVSLF